MTFKEMMGMRMKYPTVSSDESLNKVSNLRLIESRDAKTKLEKGPASEIMAASFLGFF